eukprot:TRINITY_DN36125_c0_g1_i1.p1 TRINITY_DN36125_c0_g1~~TRINITY_DN36125_c0_g1_i1.p1  ORF type:complete len:754 (-),score=128.66 TRINITY_DN36125_c0_g1_i1:53-2314(-)
MPSPKGNLGAMIAATTGSSYLGTGLEDRLAALECLPDLTQQVLRDIAEVSQQIRSLKHELHASQARVHGTSFGVVNPESGLEIQDSEAPEGLHSSRSETAKGTGPLGSQSCSCTEPDFEEDTPNVANWPAEEQDVEEPKSPPAPRLCPDKFITNQSSVSSHSTLLTRLRDMKTMRHNMELVADAQGTKESFGNTSAPASPSFAAAQEMPSESSNYNVGTFKPRTRRASVISVISGLSNLSPGDAPFEPSNNPHRMLTLRSDSEVGERLGEDDQRSASSCAISPDSRFRLACDVTSICAFLAYTMTLPFSCAYEELHFIAFQEVYLHLADSVLLINMVLSFFMGYHSKDGSIEMAPARTALKYTLTWFAFDAVVAFPYFVTKRFAVVRGLMWLFTIVKVTGICRVASLFERIQREHQLNRVRVAKAVLGLVVPAHLMACGFRLACAADQAPDPMNDLMHLYVKDLYFVIMTMTTIGYGDVVPIGMWSRAYAIFVMLIASVFFGVLVSVTAHTTRSIIDNPHQHRVNAAASFLRARGVPKGLLTKVSYLMVQHLQQGQSTSLEPELFKGLSGSVQRELSLCLLGSAVLQFPLFEGAQRSLIGDLAQLHSWITCVRGDLIAEDGQMVCEIVFVVSGTLVAALGKYSLEKHLDRSTEDVAADRDKAQQMGERLSDSGVACMLAISEGAWFGEGCLFEKERIRTSTITARSGSSLASLSSVSYHEVISRYPHVKERHLSIQAALDAGHINLADLGHGL